MTAAPERLVLCCLAALVPAVAFAQPVPLTLADATARALERLPEVAIQRDAIAIAAQGETRAEAAYDSVLRIDGRVRTRTDPINTLFVGAPEGALAPRTNIVQGSVAWSRLFESGATLTGSASTSLEATNGRFFLLTPAYFTAVGVEVRQPLLAGRRLDPHRRALKVSALDVSRGRAALEHLVAETVADVERAYWAVQATREDVRIRERSLALAEAQREDTAVRIEAGIAAEAELAAPQAEIARRRADLVRAHDQADRADIALRHLVAGTADSPAWSMAFELADEPPAAAEIEPVDALVTEALSRRPELTDVDAARQIAELDTALARERARTQLDLVAAYNLRGLAGRENPDLFVPFPGGSVTVPPDQLGGYDDSLQTLFTHRYSDVYVGVSMALPIGQRAAKADVVIATLAERRTALLREQVAHRIATEVRTAAAVLGAARDRLDAAIALEAASTDLLAAEQARFETGQSTNFFVLTRQTELAQAALTRTSARIEVARASTELLRATGRLLERRGITLEATPPASTARSGSDAPEAPDAWRSRPVAHAPATDRTMAHGSWPGVTKGTAR
jgi:outer membrane protein TolC